MARSGEEIQRALLTFARKWVGYDGSERSEAQTFLNELFAAYGTDRQAVGAKFEDFKSSAGFMDLHWPGLCIVEMKAPRVDLTAAREQVLRYWHESEMPTRLCGGSSCVREDFLPKGVAHKADLAGFTDRQLRDLAEQNRR